MKSKQKPMKHCESVYYDQVTVAKGRPQGNYGQGYYNSDSHFPISTTTHSALNANNPPMQYHHEREFMFSSNIKSHPNISKASPYMQLHTIQSGVKLVSTHESNHNYQGSYSSQMQTRENHYNNKQRSIYDQMSESRSFGQQIDPNLHHLIYAKNKNVTTKTPAQGRNNGSTTQRQTHNHDYISAQSIISPLPLSCNNKGFSKGYHMRREIDGKLERVCEKVGLMSVDKMHRAEHSSLNLPNHNNAKKQLCYSTIVYQPTQQTLPQSHLLHKPIDNSLQHRNPLNQPSLIHVYQVKIVELEKRASLQHGKIQKLEEELLRQRQLLIKKEKEWLLRENQLLSWIEENEREIEEMRERWVSGTGEDVRQLQQQNIVVIDDTPIIMACQSNNFLIDDQQSIFRSAVQQHHNTLSTHRNYHRINNPPQIKQDSTSQYSLHHRRFSNNHSTISQAQSNNKARQNNLLSTHKKSVYGNKKNDSNRRGSVGDKVQDNCRNNVRRCLLKGQSNEVTNEGECYCSDEVFYQLQTLKQPYNSQPNSLLLQSDYDLYQLISLQARSIQSLMSHLNPPQKTNPPLSLEQEQNLLFQSYNHRLQ